MQYLFIMLKKGFILLINFVLTNLVISQSKENWVQPNAWSLKAKTLNSDTNDDIIRQECNCPTTTIQEQEEKVSLIYYKKLLVLLFNENTLEKGDDGSYRRTIIFQLNKEQLDIIMNSKDPRDWDPIVTEVFRNIKSPSRLFKFLEDEEIEILSTFKWIKDSILSVFSDPSMKFILFGVLFILIIIFFSSRYNYGYFVMFLIVSFAIGYVLTYWDCNRNLQIEELAGLWKSDKDPCENLQLNQKWSIWNIFSTESTKDQCIEYLKQKNHMKLPFCRPDDVFLIYINEKILNQFQLIVTKCTSIFQTTIQTIPFPYNIIAIIIFSLLLPLYLKMIFIHVIDFRIWFNRAPLQLSHNVDDPQRSIQFQNPMRKESILNISPIGRNSVELTENEIQRSILLENSMRQRRNVDIPFKSIEPENLVRQKSILNNLSSDIEILENNVINEINDELSETANSSNIIKNSSSNETVSQTLEIKPKEAISINNNDPDSNSLETETSLRN